MSSSADTEISSWAEVCRRIEETLDMYPYGKEEEEFCEKVAGDSELMHDLLCSLYADEIVDKYAKLEG